MPYSTPDRFPCPFCESLCERLEHVRLFENSHAIAEVSDCERSPDGGSMLVWPKKHTERISDLSDAQAIAVGEMLFASSSTVLNALRPHGMHTFCSAGSLVGQSEAHMHFQIQPRYVDRPYSFAPARELPTIPLAKRAAMATELRDYRDNDPQYDTVRNYLLFREGAIPAPSLRSGVRSRLVITETTSFVALCHPQARTIGAVVILAKRDVSCFVQLARQERAELMIAIRDVTRAIEAVTDPDGLSVWWDAGHVANQATDEFVVEIVPRFTDVPYVHQRRAEMAVAEPREHEEVAETYRSHLLQSTKTTAPASLVAS